MSKKLQGLVLLFGAVLLVGVVTWCPKIAVAEEAGSGISPGLWREQVEEAVDFAQAWLFSLDMAEFQDAATQMGEAELDEARTMLEEIRADIGLICSSRSYEYASVLSVAPDETEFKIQVVFEAVFIGRRVTETLEIFLWPNGPIVLSYKVS